MADEYEFDQHTAVAPTGETGRFDADVNRAWTVGPKPNGGYLLAIAARAAAADLVEHDSDHTDPLSATAAYLHAPDPGPAQVQTEILRTGRSASHVRASIVQQGRLCVESTFVMGTLEPARESEAWWSDREPFDLPPIDDCVRLTSTGGRNPFQVSIMDRCDVRLDPEVIGFATGQPTGRGELRGWIAFADGRPVDALSLLFFIDAFPPATFDLVSAGWVPTLSLSAYVRANPVPGPLRVSQRAQVVDGPRFDEVCEVWDASDRLVAQATQLAAIRIPEGQTPPRPRR